MKMIVSKTFPYWLVLFYLLLIQTGYLFAQNQGRNWVFSDSIGLRFNNDGSITQYVSNLNGVQRHGCAAISDTQGNLLFYAGGSGTNHIPFNNPNETKLFRRDNGVIGNYVGVFSPGQILTLQFFLPSDEIKNYYHFIHMEWEIGGRHMLLCKSEIDKLGDGGMGKFTDRKRLVVNQSSDTLLQAMIPIKHANGRDWWVISHQWGNDTFLVTLIDSSLFMPSLKQRVGSIQSVDGQTYNGGNVGFYRFDSSRNKLIIINAEGLFEILDFDRCTGLLSNPNTIMPPISNVFNNGESFFGGTLSSSGQFLYVIAYNNIDSVFNISQFDLYSNNIMGSRQNIYTDTSKAGEEILQISLAPDNKIYVVCWPDTTDTTNINLPSRYYLSVIEYPDLPYPVCNFIPRGLWLNGRMVHSGLPDYIDYNLGPVDGSECDTLGIDAKNHEDISKVEIKAFPNPTSGLITVELQEEDFILYDLLGNKLAVLSSDTQGRILLPGYLSNGIYILQNLPEDKLSSIHYSRIQLLRGN